MSCQPSKTKAILLTGAAGFIGAAVAKRLMEEGNVVFAIDNYSDYYDPELKRARVRTFSQEHVFFREINLCDQRLLEKELSNQRFDVVIHLAAQAGVRYSLENPQAYFDSNLAGFFNLIEVIRKHKVAKKVLYASSSSVYGARSFNEFRVEDRTDDPESFYAATKKCNEIIATAYAKNFGIDLCGLRFFTVYGPMGRPDMAPWLFTEKILKGQPIKLFNQGEMKRDFTYIGDVVECILQIVRQSREVIGHSVYNIGRGEPVHIREFVETIEELTGKKAIVEYDDTPRGDVPNTFADITKTMNTFGYSPSTNIKEGLRRFIDWYREYYVL